MNHHILITVLSLFLGNRQVTEELRISSLSTGVRDSRQVFIGVENKFLIEDSAVVEMISHPNATFSGNTLTVKPNFTGTIGIRFVREADTVEVQFQSKFLTLAQARPSISLSKTISKQALSQDSTVVFEVNSDDDYYKGFKLAHFTGCINNLSFICDTSFCPELMDAVRNAAEGDLLKITAFELVHEQTGRIMKVRCNTPFSITP